MSIHVSKSPGSGIWRLGEPITQEVEVPIPPERVAELAKESAAATVRIGELEEELAAFRERIKDEQKPLESRVAELAPIILKGTMRAPVECQWETDEHATSVWLRRVDTGEKMPGSERAPTHEELTALRQGVLPMEVPAKGGPKRSSKGTPDSAIEAAEALFQKPSDLPDFQPDGEGPKRSPLQLVHSASEPQAAEESMEPQPPSEPQPLSTFTLPEPHEAWDMRRWPGNRVEFINGETYAGSATWNAAAGHWQGLTEAEGEAIPVQVLQAGIVAMLEGRLPEAPQALPPKSEWLTFGDWQVCATGDTLRFFTEPGPNPKPVALARVNPEHTHLLFFQGPTIEIPEQVIRFSMDAVRKGVLKLSQPTGSPEDAEEPPTEEGEGEGSAESADGDDPDSASTSGESSDKGGEEEEKDSLTPLAVGALQQLVAAKPSGVSAEAIGQRTRNRRPMKTLNNLWQRGYVKSSDTEGAELFIITEAGESRLRAYVQERAK